MISEKFTRFILSNLAHFPDLCCLNIVQEKGFFGLILMGIITASDFIKIILKSILFNELNVSLDFQNLGKISFHFSVHSGLFLNPEVVSDCSMTWKWRTFCKGQLLFQKLVIRCPYWNTKNLIWFSALKFLDTTILVCDL